MRHVYAAGLAIVIATLLVGPNLRADGATKYPTVQKLMEEAATNYSNEEGTFKVISNHPLHIQISPLIPLKSPSDWIESTVHQEAVQTVFEAFIHTPVNALTITVLPKTWEDSGKTGAPLTEFRVSLSVTRKRALALLNRYFPGKGFEDLVGTQDGGPDMPTKVFDALSSRSRDSHPGAETVFIELAQRGE
ncbi:MAG TPA: hypothetical protein VNP98_06590 [Chthoniobacterales bacterium]|nr:hypothetical protein [Chthoniobacterales bacterium]